MHERYTTNASKVRDLLENQPHYHPRPLGYEAQKRPDLNARALGGNDGDMFRNIETDRKAAVTVSNMEEFAKV